jgi:hypothetical protein
MVEHGKNKDSLMRYPRTVLFITRIILALSAFIYSGVYANTVSTTTDTASLAPNSSDPTLPVLSGNPPPASKTLDQESTQQSKQPVVSVMPASTSSTTITTTSSVPAIGQTSPKSDSGSTQSTLPSATKLGETTVYEPATVSTSTTKTLSETPATQVPTGKAAKSAPVQTSSSNITQPSATDTTSSVSKPAAKHKTSHRKSSSKKKARHNQKPVAIAPVPVEKHEPASMHGGQSSDKEMEPASRHQPAKRKIEKPASVSRSFHGEPPPVKRHRPVHHLRYNADPTNSAFRTVPIPVEIAGQHPAGNDSE